MIAGSLDRTLTRFARVLALFALLALLAACATRQPDRPPIRVLFIGNSLTYVGNLPAVFDALALYSDHPTHSDMLVKGGATLSERLDDGTATQALSHGDYDIVILQERGGDFLCAFGPDSCQHADNALRELASLARQFHAKPVLLGTYQKDPRFSKRIVEAESSAASKNSLVHVALSDAFQRAITEFPSAHWLDADGAHPGHDLALLEAVRLYQALFDAPPSAGKLVVSAPMYRPDAHFSIEVVDPGTFAAVGSELDHAHVYSEEVFSRVLKLAGNSPPPSSRGD